MASDSDRPEDSEDIPTLTEAVETGAVGRPPDPHRRHVKILLTLLVIALVGLSFTHSADDLGERYNDVAFKRALITFAVARGLNGLISVVQGTEVALQPAGLGVVFAPGEIFDPINDLIEQFSHVMLLATTSLGAQKILMQMSGWWGVNALLIVASLLAIYILWFPRATGPVLRATVFRFALLTVFIRFAVPVVSIVNEHAFSLFLSGQYQESSLVLDQTSREMREVKEATVLAEAETREPGFLERLSRLYRNTSRSLDIEERIERYKDQLSNASEHAINLIVVFLLQTVVFPIAFLWLGAALLRWIGRTFRSD
jgi:hypothetical protein